MLPEAPEEGHVKKNVCEVMEILEAFDRTGSAHSAARLAGCDPKTVRRLVGLREQGVGADAPVGRGRLVDGHTGLVDQMVDASEGMIRADMVHEKLVACGYGGSQRTTRRAVAQAKARWRASNARVARPWITMPGMWVQFDWGKGPRVLDVSGRWRSTVLFVAWVAWSRFRVVLPVWDQTSPTLATCLDSTFRLMGGVTDYLLTDNAKTVTTGHVAGLPVRHPDMVGLGAHYGATVHTCVPYDPQSKGGVEASVKLAKADLLPKNTNLRGEYSSFEELAGACRAWMDKVNHKIHSATRRRPVDMLVEERALFHPVPARPYASALGQVRLVGADQMVSYGSVGYSVPPGLVGARVWVRVQGDEVVICADTATLPVVPEWMEGHGVVEVARHKASTPGSPRIELSHYPDHPQDPTGAPRARRPKATSHAETAFLQIGPGAELWLSGACAAGVDRVPSKMARIVELAVIRGRRVVNQALETAAVNSRYQWGDVESIIEFIDRAGVPAHTVAPEGLEAVSTQPGTGVWDGFTTTLRVVP